MSTVRVPTSSSVAPAAPPASRSQPPGWRDPRLAIGVVIVTVCVLLGARVLASADDTVGVWRLRHDVPAGSSLGAEDLAVARVHLDAALTDHYLSASADLPPGSTAAHDLAAGELLPGSAVAAASGVSLVEVPLSVAPDDLPASVRRGSVVDVWVTPKAAGSDPHVRARRVLTEVVVVDVPAAADSLAPTTTRQVIVGVDDDAADVLPDALGQLADGRVVLTRRASS